MPDMPQSVSKGPILARLDEFSRSADNLRRLRDSLDVAGEASDLVQILQDHIGLSADEKNHLEKDWFNRDNDGWWPKRQPIKPVMARGFIVAVAAALRPTQDNKDSLPLDCYWVCGTGHNEDSHGGDMTAHDHGMDGAVEVNVMWSAQQVTVLLHTPGGGISHFPPGDMVPEPVIIAFAKSETDKTVFTTQASTHAAGNPRRLASSDAGAPDVMLS